MSVTALDVLTVARGELGNGENPAGSNKQKYGAWYPDNGVAWCAQFVSWVAAHAGATDIIPKYEWTPAGADWFKSRNAWYTIPKIGDIVFYDIAGMGRISHTGIVEYVYPDGSWNAIEGNTNGAGSRTGGSVMRQHRSYFGQRGGFGRPVYGSTVVVPPVEKPTEHEDDTDGGVPAGPEFPGRNMSQGMKGEDVRVLQQGLNRHAANLGRAKLDEDGDFGKKTYLMLQAYQRARGGPPFNLADDGIAGPATWKSLRQ